MIDVAIVGGGIAGLTAAAVLSRSGKTVSVFERAGHAGGRAQTQNLEGFHFNLGPHALYRGGHAFRVLGELGISIQEPKVGSWIENLFIVANPDKLRDVISPLYT